MIIYDKNDAVLLNIARIAKKRISDDITLLIDSAMNEFEGKIEDKVFTAGSYSQLLYLIGVYARNPKVENNTFKSNKEVCGMYLASHHFNYYSSAPIEELYEVIDDLALWGMNSVCMWFDMYDYENMGEGKEYSDRLIAILRYARSIGLKAGMMLIANEAFPNSPKELRADWTCGHDGYIYNLNAHYHVEICPSKEGGMEKILEYRRQWLDVFKELEPDFMDIAAYDQGGCTCSKCAPWGSNGFVRVCENLIKLFKETLPNTEIYLSLWQFGTFTGTDVEYIGIEKAISEGKLKECKFFTAEPQYARYPYEKGMSRPLLGFPEISMGTAIPWGGYGANPTPKLIQELMDKDGEKQIGGFPYSEGFFEDINKIIMLRYYRDGQSASDSVREYLSYEFGFEGEMLDRVHKAVMDMEETLSRGFEMGHRYPINKPEKVESIEKTIIEADKTLPEKIREGKRWQLIYLRAVIDAELKRNDYRRNEKTIEYFNRIIKLFYLENAGFHVKPDIVDDENYGRQLTKEELKIIFAGGTLD